MGTGDRPYSNDPAWNERVRRRRAFADVELDRGAAPLPPPPPGPPAALLCRNLLAALLTTYAPIPPHSQPQRQKLSFSIESIIGVQ